MKNHWLNQNITCIEDNVGWSTPIELANGKFWFLNNKLHREDGPAIEYVNGNKEWWLNGTFQWSLNAK